MPALTLRLILLCGCLALPALHGGEPSERPVAVRTALVMTNDQPTTIIAIGSAQAVESVALTLDSTGILTEILVADGATVSAGQDLLRLEQRVEQAEVDEAAASVADLQRRLAIEAGLLERGTGTADRAAELTANADEARARLAAAQARLDKRTLRAPFAGVLGPRMVSPGALVGPGTTVAHLVDGSRLRLRVAVPEIHAARVQVGQTLRASGPAFGDAEITASIDRIDPLIDPGTRTLGLEALVDNPGGVVPGGFIEARIAIAAATEGVTVPEAAVLRQGPTATVFVLTEEGLIRRVPVQVLERRAGRILVSGELSPDQRVVVEGLQKVRDGVKATELGGSRP